MKSISGVIATMIEKFDSMISTFGGFVCAVFIAMFEFLAGYKVAILVVFVAVFLDMIWGIAAARAQKKYARSELMRDTITKVGGYGAAILMTAMLENLLIGSHTIGIDDGANTRWAVDVVAFVISCTEFWSMSGNILIVRPNSVFFRIIRMSLVGEIARKLGMQEDEVKKVFEKNGDFKPNSDKQQQTAQ